MDLEPKFRATIARVITAAHIAIVLFLLLGWRADGPLYDIYTATLSITLFTQIVLGACPLTRLENLVTGRREDSRFLSMIGARFFDECMFSRLDPLIGAISSVYLFAQLLIATCLLADIF